MVRKERLELSRREALEPKSSVSTNSTTPAKECFTSCVDVGLSNETKFIANNQNLRRIWINALDNKKADLRSAFLNLVRKERLELSRREALEPKSSVSTNSTTPARNGAYYRDPRSMVKGFISIF